MQLKDATRVFGRLGLLLPLILIFLAADPAFACPGHTSRVVYRTKAINTRTVSHMPTTVITYRAPASYARCVANMYNTRGAKYVAVRSNGHHTGARYVAMRGNGTRYVAVRYDDDLDRPKLRRYGAVYDVAYGDAPRRYVAVRRPVYVDTGTRYVAVRRIEPRVRYVAVRHIDIDDDDEIRYVAVRRHINYDPGVRYVAVRTVAPRTRYVAVRNIDGDCVRAAALRSCPDQVETTSKRHVVIRTDDLAGTQAVVYDTAVDDDPSMLRNESDDTAIALPSDNDGIAYTDAAYSNGNSATYIATNDFDNTYVRNVAVHTYPEAVSTRMITYAPAYGDDDSDDQAILDGSGATYIAADDIGDACLSPVAVTTPREVVSTRAMSYIPVADVDDDVSSIGNEPTYIATEAAAAPAIRYVTDDDEVDVIDADATFVADDGVDATCLRQVAVRTCGDDVSPGTISYVPFNNVDVDAETISYMPVEDMDVSTVSYVPVDEVDMQNVSYVPVEDIEGTDTEAVSYVPVDNSDVITASD